MTRTHITRHIGTAFIGGGATRLDLVALARVNEAPAPLVAALRGLPDRRFRHVHEVWELLEGLPGTTPTRGGVTS